MTDQVILVPEATDLDSSIGIIERRFSVLAPKFSKGRRPGHLLDGKAVGVGHEQPPKLEPAAGDVAPHLKMTVDKFLSSIR